MMYVIGGIHSIVGAREAQERYDKEKIKDRLPDPHWKKFPCKLYFTKDKFEDIAELVRFIALEDNVNYRLVGSGFEIINFFRKHHFQIHFFLHDNYSWTSTSLAFLMAPATQMKFGQVLKKSAIQNLRNSLGVLSMTLKRMSPDQRPWIPESLQRDFLLLHLDPKL